MQSIRRGFGFFKQSWQMALADRDLIKPTIYALIVGVLVTVVGLVPIVLTQLLFGTSDFGTYLSYFLGLVLVLAQYTVTYIFSAMTIYLIYGYLSEGDGRMDKAWKIVRRDFFDLVMLALASTGVKVIEGFLRGKRRGGLGNLAANILNTIWTEATYLVLPAMVIEDLGLRDGLRRATRIIKENLLLVGVSTVGVGFVTGLLGFLLGATVIVLGLGVGYGLVSVLGSETLGIIAGITVGGSIAAAFILLAVLIGNYTTTAYHACLYLWARDVERAQDAGGEKITAATVQAPAPLAAVLGS